MEEPTPILSGSSDDALVEAESTKTSSCEDASQSGKWGAEDDLSGGTVHLEDETEHEVGETNDGLTGTDEHTSGPESASPVKSSSENNDPLDIFSLVARQQKLKAAQKKESQLLVLASLYGQAGNRESFSQQSHTFTILKGAFGSNVPPFTIIDASDPENFPQRDALLALSGLGPVYPQFFLVKAKSKKATQLSGSGEIDEDSFEGDGAGTEMNTVDLNDSCLSLSGFMVSGLDEYDDIQFFGDYQDLFVANERRTLRSSFMMSRPLVGLGQEIVNCDVDDEEAAKEQEEFFHEKYDDGRKKDASPTVDSKNEADTENVTNAEKDEFVQTGAEVAECNDNKPALIISETPNDKEEEGISFETVPDEKEEENMEEDLGVNAGEPAEDDENHPGVDTEDVIGDVATTDVEETRVNLDSLAELETEEQVIEGSADVNLVGSNAGDNNENEAVEDCAISDVGKAVEKVDNITGVSKEICDDNEAPTEEDERQLCDSPEIEGAETPADDPLENFSNLGISAEPKVLDEPSFQVNGESSNLLASNTSLKNGDTPKEEDFVEEQKRDDKCTHPPSVARENSEPVIESEDNVIAPVEEFSASVDSGQKNEVSVDATIPRGSPPSAEEDSDQTSPLQSVTEKGNGENVKSKQNKKALVLGGSRMKKDPLHLAGNLEVPEWVDLYFILPSNPVVNWTENKTKKITDDRKIETTMEITLYLKDGEQVKQSHSTLEFT